MSKRKPEWNDAQIFDINKQPTRCTSLPYDSTESAMRKSGSPYVISLDGEWRFHWVACPAERIKDFYLPGFNDHDWKLLAVPSQWELNGYGVPIYAPFHMPPSLHKRNMPNIDARDNPVGAYRYVFNLPAEWEEREIYLHSNGVFQHSMYGSMVSLSVILRIVCCRQNSTFRLISRMAKI